jgi:hypothetical protein
MAMPLWVGDADTMDEQPGLTGDEHGAASAGVAGRQRWRTIVAVVLIVLGCVLAPLAGVAVSVRMALIGNMEWRRSRNLVSEIARECAPGP